MIVWPTVQVAAPLGGVTMITNVVLASLWSVRTLTGVRLPFLV